MNRLVIIGNGFDLAHGLPTSYRNFIDDFWVNFKTEVESEVYQKLITNNQKYNGFYNYGNSIYNYKDFKLKLTEYCKEYKFIFDTEKSIAYTSTRSNRENLFEFKNIFFRDINNKNSENWVDIENEYYTSLKEIVKNIEYSKEKKEDLVKNLNEEFEQVKNLLENYLLNKVKNQYKFHYGNDLKPIYDVLKPISFLSSENNILKEFTNPDDIEEIKAHFQNEKKEELVNKIYFLNFNYTPTVSLYSDLLNKEERIKSKVNFIHGELGNKTDNTVNFGFGDEMDDDYKEIENLDNNEYLKNFKSFQYLQNSNYNDLLSYVESEKFQVVIIGHSCGLSDRTLLNTIFEHENCRSIKVFYYKNGDYDNYTDMVQNISRHFNDKKLMRSKIVSKTYCKPLPQIELPKKE
ncbi:AbiH family protein [Flavobacterium sp.]|uniref:AbiH family protein n=1 Tax=Flavobacterium sp. TaxID=239 RepID=UPI0040485580